MPLEPSILVSTKKILGIDAANTAFDLDITIAINSALSTLSQLGVGPVGGLTIEDDSSTWDELGVPSDQLNLTKTYIFLKAKFLFDPPTTRFTIQAAETQLAEHEWRLKQMAEALNALPVGHPDRPTPTYDGQVIYVPLTTYIEGGY